MALAARHSDKRHLRVELLAKLKKQGEGVRNRRSQAIWRKLARLTVFRRAKVVCSYVALPYEVQTWRMIEEMILRGKRVVVPAVVRGSNRMRVHEIRNPSKDLARGSFGVPEPVRGLRRKAFRLRDIDLVLVPGVAFDKRGHRLGHGYGYFDRFLSRLPDKTATLGLCYRFQLFDNLPTASHDQPVNRVIAG